VDPLPEKAKQNDQSKSAVVSHSCQTLCGRGNDGSWGFIFAEMVTQHQLPAIEPERTGKRVLQSFPSKSSLTFPHTHAADGKPHYGTTQIISLMEERAPYLV
jgi:hypothetical protein